MTCLREHPASAIWRLLSGIVEEKRVARGLMFLEGYFDDSGDQQGPTFLLGGLVSSAGKWASFASEWADELGRDIPLEYFKAAEAYGLRDQFSPARGWDRALRDKKVERLCAIVRAYAGFRTHVSVDMNAFRKIVLPGNAKFQGHNAEKPYWLAFHRIVLNIVFGQMSNTGLGVPIPVDFIFDEQGAIGDAAGASMNVVLRDLKAARLPGPIQPKDYIRSSPIFRDDKDVLPLQAADMYAWSVNRCFVNHARGVTETVPPFSLIEALPRMQFHYDETELHALMKDAPDWL